MTVDSISKTAVVENGALVAWDIALSWSGGSPPYTVVAGTDPSFQRAVVTLGDELNATTLTHRISAQDDRWFYDVVDGATVSPAVQGMGYDPLPAPGAPTVGGQSYWWGDTVTLSAEYLSPIAADNVMYWPDLATRAESVNAPAGSEYATAATFTVPDDARSTWALIQAHGRAGKPGDFISLSPPGIGPYTNIRGVAWASDTGRVWVAADGIVADVDLFLRTPNVVWSTADSTQPLISRITQAGTILVIDRAAPSVVHEISVTGHGQTTFAQTTDDGFTRTVDPVGIAVDPDGSVCYIADASSGKVVRIPAGAGPGGSTIDDEWGGRTFTFPDPCGIDVAPTHQVMVADDGTGYVWQLWGPDPGDAAEYPVYRGPGLHGIEVDRDVSGPEIRHVVSNTPFAEAFNKNALSGGQPAYHGGVVFGLGDGRLELDPDWSYFVTRHYPQRVILNNAGTDFPYSSAHQVADRVIELKGLGWEGVPVRLRLIDPPDLAPYAPDGGWPNSPPADPAAAAPPYEGNDNAGYADPDYGLSGSAGGPWSQVLSITPGADETYTVYLKVPARYSGDNFQVEVTKCKSGGTPLSERIVAMSSIYTSWKRIFIERDKMFRDGGVLAEDYVPQADCGTAGNPICDCIADPNANCCKGIGPVTCNQLVAYEWQTAAPGDEVAVFDQDYTLESAAQFATVTAVATGLTHGLARITLDHALSRVYTASDRIEPDPPASYQPTFSNHKSAGYGVISNCDLSDNQINGVHSCFYRADLRGIEKAYNDAFVEVFAPREGMGAVPYVAAGSGVLDTTNPFPSGHFSRTWFQHFLPAAGDGPQATPHNYFHMTGIANNLSTASGWSVADYDMIMISTGWIHDTWGSFPEYDRQAAVHELGHMFRVDPCDILNHHDSNFAWCGAEGGACAVAPLTHERCAMYENKSDPEWFALIQNDVNRFCCANLFGPVAGQYCQNQSCAQEDGIRNHTDPE